MALSLEFGLAFGVMDLASGDGVGNFLGGFPLLRPVVCGTCNLVAFFQFTVCDKAVKGTMRLYGMCYVIW